MQKYQDSVLSTSGSAVLGASVTVTTYPGGVAASLFSDNGVTPIIGNVLTTDVNGRFSFYAADGRYQLVVSGSGITQQTISDVLLEDVFPDLSASSGSSLVGFIQSGTGAIQRTLQDIERAIARSGDYNSLANFNTAVQGLTETIGVFGLAASENLTTGAGMSLLELAISQSDAPFQIHLSPASQNTGAGAGTYNHGLFMGYNIRRHSSIGSATANTPSLIMAFENDYYDDGGDNKHASEWYIEYYSPDGTSVQLYRPYYARIYNGDNSAHAATIYQDFGTDGTGTWQVRGGAGNIVLSVTPTRFTISQPIVAGVRADMGYASFGVSDFTYDASADRMGIGRLAALPSNSVGSYVGWANGIAGTSAGDLLLIPRSSNPSAIRFYSGSTTPVERWNISSSGHLLATTDNTLDFGAAGATRARTGYFGTSVITPLLTAATHGSGAASGIAFTTSGGTQFNVSHVASAVNNITVEGGATGVTPKIYAAGSNTDISMELSAKGAGSVTIYNNTFSQVGFQVVAVASSNRYIQVSPSNGGNPTIGVSAGRLNVSSALTLSSLGAFAASDKYLIADASGNVHVSALGPAS